MDRRTDPLTGKQVVITGGRQKRPNQPLDGCPFCPGGLEAPDAYDTHWFTNRWPAIDDGRAEVVLYTPEHEGSFWSLGLDRQEAVVRLWEERTRALGERDDVAYVLVFENRGAEVGATIAHPHGQIYAFDAVPPAAGDELGDDCALCAGPPGEAVTAVGDWSAVVPHAATWPYEMLLAPTAHLGDLLEATASRRDFAACLSDALARLDRLFDAPMPYMLWIHQRPFDGGEWPSVHLHVHIAPVYRSTGLQRYVAAGELGSGVFFNPVVPEVAAQQLRDA